MKSAPPTPGLRRNALGLLATASLTAAYMGPALSVYALYGPLTNHVGAGLGFVMMLTLALTLPSAVSFGMLAKEMPSAGGVYAWARKALGEAMGVWLGLMGVAYYLICLLLTPILFGQFFNGMLEQMGVPIDVWTWLAGGALMLVIGATVAYRGVLVSAHLAFTLLMIETVVVVALAATLLLDAIHRGTFTFAPLTFAACKDGWRGVFLALPIGLVGMTCDVATPTSEETRDARWTIPMAIFLACVLVGAWYVVGFSAFALEQPVASGAGAAANDLATSPQSLESATLNIMAPMVARVWGPFKILVSITAMTASLGAFIPGLNACSRVLFAMARDGKLPAGLAKLHPHFQSPWNAVHVVLALAVLGVIPPVLWFGANPTLDWWSDALGWFIGVVYTGANLVNIVYYWRFARERFNVVLNLLLPLAAIVTQVIVAWNCEVVGLWENGPRGQSVQAFLAIASFATLCYAFVRSRSMPLND